MLLRHMENKSRAYPVSCSSLHTSCKKPRCVKPPTTNPRKNRLGCQVWRASLEVASINSFHTD
ncbi:unnamed protein product [Ranitomeya imitator]|uniref:Uncharacterized protein n=1 Tax=Ranitomeya imitator TaxID=111125 RepID=A0ABN9LYZ7_9NEOB|nr:unnamed protein product [Ranitomeya imitator]